MVYEIENAKLTLRAFGQTQFITKLGRTILDT
jgi:hypothetical protein